AEADDRFRGSEGVGQAAVQQVGRPVAAAGGNQCVGRRIVQGIEKFLAALFGRAREVALGEPLALRHQAETEALQFPFARGNALPFRGRSGSDRSETRTLDKSLWLLPPAGRGHSCCLSTGSISTLMPGRVRADRALCR